MAKQKRIKVKTYLCPGYSTPYIHFVHIWNTSVSFEEVIERLGNLKLAYIIGRVVRSEKLGYKLKRLHYSYRGRMYIFGEILDDKEIMLGTRHSYR